MTKATIYHNPRCSKSRQTLEILKTNNIEVEEIRYLDSPPSKATLKSLCKMMDINPKEIVRTGEALFKELGLAQFYKETSLNDDEWLTLLTENPKLIERPIVQIGNQAVIGRPPENVLSLI